MSDDEVSDEKLRRADRRVTKLRRSLEHSLSEAGVDERRRESIERAASAYGIAVASLCIEVERMSEQEGWHE